MSTNTPKRISPLPARPVFLAYFNGLKDGLSGSENVWVLLDTLWGKAQIAQVGEAMAMIRALNKMTRASMPESVRIA
ncbi:hypothetical protein [Pectobacterium versatile]|uniref:hypothetical protein n=1 Tax=Pectobacterium versatile TaxID=2488639 RepID=UPI00398C3D70